jgi:hypothetical protein
VVYLALDPLAKPGAPGRTRVGLSVVAAMTLDLQHASSAAGASSQVAAGASSDRAMLRAPPGSRYARLRLEIGEMP